LSIRPITESVFLGLAAGVLIALLPFLFGQWSQRVPSARPEGWSLFIGIAALAFLGNLLEEAIFRGHFQNYLNELKLSNGRIILLSGAAFSVCHTFLAFTVTHAGWPVLAFTFYEGLICAYLRQRNGLISAALAHGMGLFLILSGILS
jgi:membrane protease YdiL (CAAX protease family)